jgi:putative phosphoribosyl transferase
VSADKTIPARPSLEQYRKQAKDLVKERARLLPEAFQRIRRHHPRLRDMSEAELRRAAFTLSDAQLVLAREHAFKTWPEFARHLASARPADPPERYFAHIDGDGIELVAEVSGWRGAQALVLLVQASGSRAQVSAHYIAEELNRASFGTIVCDLLTEEEAFADSPSETLHYDIRLLARRIGALTDWTARQPSLSTLNVGCFSSGTGAAAMLLAAAERPNTIRAIVSNAGRPDLAGPWLGRVQAPTLCLAGTRDSTVVLSFVGSAMHALPRTTGASLDLIEGTGSAVSKGPFLEEVARRACRWFRQYLVSGGQPS